MRLRNQELCQVEGHQRHRGHQARHLSAIHDPRRNQLIMQASEREDCERVKAGLEHRHPDRKQP